MRNSWFKALVLFGFVCSGSVPAVASEPVRVVATFSVLADIASEIGKERVDVKSLVGWSEDAHVFRPSPQDVKRLSEAELLVANGLGFEGWLPRLVSAAAYKGLYLEASQGVELVHLEGDQDHQHEHHHGHDEEDVHEDEAEIFDPHAWHSIRAIRTYVLNISKALQSIDEGSKSFYQNNAALYLKELDDLEGVVREEMSRVPKDSRHIVVPHNAFAYLARDWGLHVHSLQGLSTEAEASAASIAGVVRQIKEYKVKAIFSENISDTRLINIVKRETGVAIGGALISGALSHETAPTYLDMMKHNTQLIYSALK